MIHVFHKLHAGSHIRVIIKVSVNCFWRLNIDTGTRNRNN